MTTTRDPFQHCFLRLSPDLQRPISDDWNAICRFFTQANSDITYVETNSMSSAFSWSRYSKLISTGCISSAWRNALGGENIDSFSFCYSWGMSRHKALTQIVCCPSCPVLDGCECIVVPSNNFLFQSERKKDHVELWSLLSGLVSIRSQTSANAQIWARCTSTMHWNHDVK